MEKRENQVLSAPAEGKHFLIWVGLWVAALLTFLPR